MLEDKNFENVSFLFGISLPLGVNGLRALLLLDISGWKGGGHF